MGLLTSDEHLETVQGMLEIVDNYPERKFIHNQPVAYREAAPTVPGPTVPAKCYSKKRPLFSRIWNFLQC